MINNSWQHHFDISTRVLPHKHNSTWTWLLLVYFSEVNKLRLHVELIPISEHQHDFKFSWSLSKFIYLLSTYKMVGIFLMLRKLSIDGTKDWQRDFSYIDFLCTKRKTFFLNLKKSKHLFHETPNYTKHYMKLKIFKVLHFYWKWGLRYTPLVGMKQAPITWSY